MAGATLIDLIEQIAEFAADQAVEQTETVVELLGERPAFSRHLDAEEEAWRNLPLWLTGRNDPAYWQTFLSQHADNTINPPIKTAMQFSLRMQELLGRYPAAAVLGMTPQMVQAFRQQLAAGGGQA